MKIKNPKLYWGSAIVMALVISIAMILAFGVYDVQCKDPNFPSWNADAQICEEI